MTGRIVAPWTPAQVAALTAWQGNDHVHPFTCGDCRAVLVATAEGWHCPRDGCAYRQTWAHAFMAQS